MSNTGRKNAQRDNSQRDTFRLEKPKDVEIKKNEDDIFEPLERVLTIEKGTENKIEDSAQTYHPLDLLKDIKNNKIELNEFSTLLKKILSSETMGNFEKKCCLEKLIQEINDKNIELEIPGNSNDFESLRTNLIDNVKLFKKILLGIPPSLETFTAAEFLVKTLHKLYEKEFESNSIKAEPLQMTRARDALIHTSGFMQKTDAHTPEQKMEDTRTKEEKESFDNYVKDKAKKKIFLAYASAIHSLSILDIDNSSSENAVYEEFKISSFQKRQFDVISIKRTYGNHFFYTANQGRVLEATEKEKIKNSDINRKHRDLFGENSNQILTLQPLFMSSRTWSQWAAQYKKIKDSDKPSFVAILNPEYTDSETKDEMEEYNINTFEDLPRYLRISEYDLLREFSTRISWAKRLQHEENYKITNKREDDVLPAFAFVGSGLKFFNTLDFYSRNPQHLENVEGQIYFMMGIFGAGGIDLKHLDNPDFLNKFIGIIRKNVALFETNQNPRHGIFLLELLAQLREARPQLFEGNYINADLKKMLEISVSKATENNPRLKKRLYCTQLIHEILSLRDQFEKKSLPLDLKEKDIEAFCDILLLYKKQSESFFTFKNYHLYERTGSLYLNFIYDFYNQIKNHDAFKRIFINRFFPSRMDFENEIGSIEVDNFPYITFTDLNNNHICFDLINGIIIDPNKGEFQMKNIPDGFLQDQNYPEHCKNFLKSINQKIEKDESLNLFYIPSQKQNKRGGFDLRIKYGNSYQFETINNTVQLTIDDTVYIQVTDRQIHFSAKKDVDYQCGNFWKNVFFDNPENTVWFALDPYNQNKNRIIVLDGNLQKIYEEVLFIENHYEDTFKMIDSDKNEYSIVNFEPERYDPSVANAVSNFEKIRYRMCEGKNNSFFVDLPAYGIRLIRNDKKKFAFQGNENLILQTELVSPLPGTMTFADSNKNNMQIIMRDPPPGAQPLKQEITQDEPYFKGKFFNFILDEQNKPIAVTGQDKLFLTHYYLSIKEPAFAYEMIQSFRKNNLIEPNSYDMLLLYRIIKNKSDNPITIQIKMHALLIITELIVAHKIDLNSFSYKEVKDFYEAFPNVLKSEESQEATESKEPPKEPASKELTKQAVTEIKSKYLDLENIENHSTPANNLLLTLSNTERNILGLPPDKRIKTETPSSSSENETKFDDSIINDFEAFLTYCKEVQKNNKLNLLSNVYDAIETISLNDIILAWYRNDKKLLSEKLGIRHDSRQLEDIFKQLERLILDDVTKNIYKGNKPSYLLNQNTRALLVYEYYNRIQLRENQVEALQYILQSENENTCLQFIMGGGKTSVFNPIAAIKRADGVCLSVVVVPNSLLSTNQSDLNKKTTQSFSSKSRSIYFDRSSPCDPASLERILNTLLDVIENRDYLIISREVLQALEAKYIELKRIPKKSSEQLKSLSILKEINCLFKQKGKALIDEVDTVLDIRKEFNYSCGENVPMNQSLISDTLLLYQLIEEQNGELTIDELDELLDKLTQSPKMNPLINQAGGLEIFKQYILNKTPLPESIKKTEDKNRLALLKHQLETLLSSCQQLELNVTYGLSRQNQTKMSAIPYSSNNIALEKSSFSSPYETLNLTILTHLQTSPINHEAFRLFVEDFIKGKSLMNPAVLENITERNILFKKLTNQSIDDVLESFRKTGNYNEIINTISQNPELEKNLKYYLLENYIGPSITYAESEIRCDSISFVDQFQSVIGISGTVESHQTFHHKLKLANDAHLYHDINGEILKKLKEKNNGKTTVETHSQEKITRNDIEDALKSMPFTENTRAIIDIGALFSGMNNQIIAEKIAENIDEPISIIHRQDISYVLYYDEANYLCAYNIQDKFHKRMEQTDEKYLREKLPGYPEKSFTFYDHARTTGSDIKQMPHAHAVATIGKNTTTRDLVQGVMRLRQFNEADTSKYNQTVSFFISANIKDDPSLQDIESLTRKNEMQKLAEDCYHSACKQIRAITRHKALDILYKFEGHPHSDQVFKILENYFIRQSSSVFDQFGVQADDISIQNMMNKLINEQLNVFITNLIEISKLTGQEEGIIERIKIELTAEMQQTCKLALNNLDIENKKVKSYTTAEQLHGQTENEVEVMAQTNVQSNLETKKRDYTEDFLPDNAPRETVLPDQWDETYFAGMKSIYEINNLFGKNIKYSHNYCYANFQKPTQKQLIQHQPFFIYCLYSLNNQGQLSCILLTAEEASDFIDKGSPWHEPNTTIWIENPTGMVVSPERPRPNNLENNSTYKEMQEQIQFFHGDIDLILECPNHPWLKNKDPTALNQFWETCFSNPLFIQKKVIYDQNKNITQTLVTENRANPNNEAVLSNSNKETKKSSLKLFGSSQPSQVTVPVVKLESSGNRNNMIHSPYQATEDHWLSIERQNNSIFCILGESNSAKLTEKINELQKKLDDDMTTEIIPTKSVPHLQAELRPKETRISYHQLYQEECQTSNIDNYGLVEKRIGPGVISSELYLSKKASAINYTKNNNEFIRLFLLIDQQINQGIKACGGDNTSITTLTLFVSNPTMLNVYEEAYLYYCQQKGFNCICKDSQGKEINIKRSAQWATTFNSAGINKNSIDNASMKQTTYIKQAETSTYAAFNRN